LNVGQKVIQGVNIIDGPVSGKQREQSSDIVDNQSPLILLWPNGLWKLSNFVGLSLALEKELIAHFLAFLANCLGAILMLMLDTDTD